MVKIQAGDDQPNQGNQVEGEPVVEEEGRGTVVGGSRATISMEMLNVDLVVGLGGVVYVAYCINCIGKGFTIVPPVDLSV